MANVPGVLRVKDLHVYFLESLRTAVANQDVETTDETVNYLGGMLTRYTHADRLYDRTENGVVRTPLALIYKAARESDSEAERRLHFQRLGDMALFISGVFSGCLRRSLVDVDYYVGMGESAYAYLSARPPASRRDSALTGVFDELARQFVACADLLAEVCEQLRDSEEKDPARLDELWARTGSRRIARKLREHGVTPATPCRSIH
jgi:hypothetical protein